MANQMESSSMMANLNYKQDGFLSYNFDQKIYYFLLLPAGFGKRNNEVKPNLESKLFGSKRNTKF